MRIQLYNTLTRKKEDFMPIEKGKAGVYACGPTVYWFATIGNFRSSISWDLLRRSLQQSGLDVTFIMNITDVGHLTDDADAGDDKMLMAMQKEGKSAREIADFYTDAFLKDIDRLNILRADRYPKATEHIAEQIDMILEIEKNGYAYQTSDGVYFDTSRLADYGRLSHQAAEEKKAGARVDMGEKKHVTDFALWKFSPANGPKREMEWDSPWGVGFPGWHIECSAMARKYLDIPFDIHTGGEDLAPIHHENEIAQVEGAEGELEAHVWMHGAFLTVDGGKMSKSLGNAYTIQDVVDRGFDPLAFRYLCLGAHYRSMLNFTFEALEGAQNALNHLRDTVRAWDAPTDVETSYRSAFMEAIANDLDVPQALAQVWKLVDDASVASGEKSATLLKMDEVLGLGLSAYVATPLLIPAEVQTLVDERENARQAKDWQASDALRDQIAERGFLVEDGPDGPRLREKR